MIEIYEDLSIRNSMKNLNKTTNELLNIYSELKKLEDEWKELYEKYKHA